MKTQTEATAVKEPSILSDAMLLGKHYLGRRRTLILLAVAILGLGTALNWSWLAAVGVAPLILAVAPCAAMCALGLCMKPGGKSCSSKTPASLPTDQGSPREGS